MDCPLSLGVYGEHDPESPTSADSLIEEVAGFRYWIDGKARACIISTPVRHVRTFEELTGGWIGRGCRANRVPGSSPLARADDELAEMWRGMRHMLLRLSTEPDRNSLLPTIRLVVNIGKYQTHAHIHLKAYVEEDAFRRAVVSPAWRDLGLAAKYQRIASWIEHSTHRKRHHH